MSSPASPYDAGDPPDAVVALLAAARRRGPLAGPTTVLAIDGPSGSGKTMFAERVAAAVADLIGPGHPEVLHMDDLYRGWDGLAAAVWLLVGSVLAPLAEGRPAGFRRYDWERAQPAEYHAVRPGGWLIVEGAGCGSTSATPYLSGLAWLDAPADQRRRRALARDGATYEPHWAGWARQEETLFAAERTGLRADVRLDTRDRTDGGSRSDGGDERT